MISSPPILKKGVASLIFKLVRVILLAFFAASFIKLLFFSVYLIPSQSMTNTLLPGDYIIVGKIQYGPRLDWGSLFIVSENRQQYGKRLPGLSSVKRNEVVVFNSPLKPGTTLVKRCVALPGDVIRIVNAHLLINGSVQKDVSANYDFKLVSYNKAETERLLYANLEKGKWTYNTTRKAFYITCTADKAEFYKRAQSTKKINVVNRKSGKSKNLFPISKSGQWSPDNYGPLKVPARNARIALTLSNLMIYGYYIAAEGNSIEWKENCAYVNSKPMTTYQFKENYYFMMGDNRHHSRDSRWIGIVPERNIIGKALLIIYSENSENSKIRFDRLFKWVN